MKILLHFFSGAAIFVVSIKRQNVRLFDIILFSLYK